MSGEHSAGPEPPVAFVGKQMAHMPVREWRTRRQADGPHVGKQTARTSASRRPARRQADGPHVGRQTARMSARGRSECRLENGIQLGKGMALVTAARVSIPAGGWMGNAHDAFSVQRKGKRQQLYGRAANHMGSRRICRLGFSPISAMIAPPNCRGSIEKLPPPEAASKRRSQFQFRAGRWRLR
jgi:hypothetical protein